MITWGGGGGCARGGCAGGSRAPEEQNRSLRALQLIPAKFLPKATSLLRLRYVYLTIYTSSHVLALPAVVLAPRCLLYQLSLPLLLISLLPTEARGTYAPAVISVSPQTSLVLYVVFGASFLHFIHRIFPYFSTATDSSPSLVGQWLGNSYPLYRLFTAGTTTEQKSLDLCVFLTQEDFILQDSTRRLIDSSTQRLSLTHPTRRRIGYMFVAVCLSVEYLTTVLHLRRCVPRPKGIPSSRVRSKGYTHS